MGALVRSERIGFGPRKKVKRNAIIKGLKQCFRELWAGRDPQNSPHIEATRLMLCAPTSTIIGYALSSGRGFYLGQLLLAKSKSQGGI